MVPAEHTGKPQLCVVHAWGMPFRQMVEQLAQSLAPGTNARCILRLDCGAMLSDFFLTGW